MNEQLQEVIAQQLHREYRATQLALDTASHKHNHGWKYCRNKHYFQRRAAALENFLSAIAASNPQVVHVVSLLANAQKLLAIIVRAYNDVARQRDNQTALAQYAIADLEQALEAAASAGCALERNSHGNWIGRNKLVAGKPTRIIKLPNVNFYTMKITHVDGKPIGPISVLPDVSPLLHSSVPDATGDDRTYHGGSSDPMGD